MSVLQRLQEARREEEYSFSIISTASSALLSAVEQWQGEPQQKSPYIEDIDLLKETVVLRNPSRYDRDLTNWKISDDNGCNMFQFPERTKIGAGDILTVYCCAKGLSVKNLHHPYIIWTNRDGAYRMKNVLNDDGDKISLLSDNDILVASCEKYGQLMPVLMKKTDRDYIPLKRKELAMNLAIMLTYLRLTFIFAMTFSLNSSFLFISSFMLAVLFGALSREFAFQYDNLDYLYYGLSILADLLIVLTSYTSVMKCSVVDVTSSFTSIRNFGNIFQPRMIIKIIPWLLVIDVSQRFCYLYTLLFKNEFGYTEDIYTRYRRRMPQLLHIVELGSLLYFVELYISAKNVQLPLSSYFPFGQIRFLVYFICAGCFVFKQYLNAALVFESIRRFSACTTVDETSVDEEAVEPVFETRIPSPQLPSPPQAVLDSTKKPKARKKSISKRVTISAVDENVPQQAYDEEDIHSDYNLRVGSSLAHLSERQALVKTPSKRSVQTPSNKRSSSSSVISPYNEETVLKMKMRQTPFNRERVPDDDEVSSISSDKIPAKLIYRRF